MRTAINCTGLWCIPGGEKLLGTLAFDEKEGGRLSVIGRFPDMSDVEKDRFNYPIIIGESDDHQKFTLRNCSLRKSYPYIDSLSKSELNVDTIIVGHQFQTVESIQFEKFSIVFSNIDKIISPIAKHVTFNNRKQILEVSIKDYCLIRIFAKTTVEKENYTSKTFLRVDTDIQIVSMKEKTFEKYQEIYNLLLDFFNFFLFNDVDLVSLTGFYKITDGSGQIIALEPVSVLYRYPPLTDSNKPNNNINFYMERKYCLWLPKLLTKWFQIHLAKKFEVVFNLYFAVMFGGSDSFLEFEFLALAQALEVYHTLTIGDASVFRMDRVPQAEEIRNIIGEHLPEKANWVDEMLSNSVNPSLRERLMDLFGHYEDFCYAYLRFNNKELLAQKIKTNRHYFTHWASKLKKKSVADEDLLWLMKDTQFLVRLCLLSELGINDAELRLIFCLEKMIEIRKVRENEDKAKEKNNL